jgi:hypothetical protein
MQWRVACWQLFSAEIAVHEECLAHHVCKQVLRNQTELSRIGRPVTHSTAAAGVLGHQLHPPSCSSSLQAPLADLNVHADILLSGRWLHAEILSKCELHQSGILFGQCCTRVGSACSPVLQVVLGVVTHCRPATRVISIGRVVRCVDSQQRYISFRASVAQRLAYSLVEMLQWCHGQVYTSATSSSSSSSSHQAIASTPSTPRPTGAVTTGSTAPLCL